MRAKRKPDEVWAVSTLVNRLQDNNEVWHEDTAFVDAPDLVLENGMGKRVACEITNVGMNEWFRWHRDKSLRPGLGKLSAWTMPREPDVWIRNAVRSKSTKVPNYLRRANAVEAWLLVLAGHGPVTSFFVVDEQEGYDLPLMQEELMRFKHPFTRIFVLSDHGTEKIAAVFPPKFGRPRAPDLSSPVNVKALTVRTMEAQLSGGVTEFRLGQEFTPDDRRVLPLLEQNRKPKSDHLWSPANAKRP